MKRVLFVLVALIAVAVVFVATRPNTYHVERSITLAAPADHVFSRVNNFHRWEQWSPWGKLDPKMSLTFSGADSGQGAVYHWAGNKDAGEGRMTIIESVPNEKVAIRLEFLKPFPSNCVTVLTFTPRGNGTQITWKMDGDQTWTVKALSLFMSMDQAVGKDFEKGLAKLKELGEAAAAIAPADTTRG